MLRGRERFPVCQRGHRPLRRDGRAGNRAPRSLSRLVRGDQDRIPAALPRRLPWPARGGNRRADARGPCTLPRRGALRRQAHDSGPVRRRARRPLPFRLSGRARRRADRRRLDETRLRLGRRPPAHPRPGLAGRSNRRGRSAYWVGGGGETGGPGGGGGGCFLFFFGTGGGGRSFVPTRITRGSALYEEYHVWS